MEQELELIQEMQQETFYRKYEEACRIVVERLERINKEVSLQKDRNYIKDISWRVKSPASCLNKMHKKNYELSLSSAQERLNDIAGVRAVCYFLDDVYQLADILTAYSDFELVKKKDYVNKPKASGYQSLHLILKVMAEEEAVKVEVQLRTRAMDFWADIEHHFIYKAKEVGMEQFEQEFIKCSKSVQKIDRQMMKIRKKMETMGV